VVVVVVVAFVVGLIRHYCRSLVVRAVTFRATKVLNRSVNP
jgi:hypothetical protein